MPFPCCELPVILSTLGRLRAAGSPFLLPSGKVLIKSGLGHSSRSTQSIPCTSTSSKLGRERNWELLEDPRGCPELLEAPQIQTLLQGNAGSGHRCGMDRIRESRSGHRRSRVLDPSRVLDQVPLAHPHLSSQPKAPPWLPQGQECQGWAGMSGTHGAAAGGKEHPQNQTPNPLTPLPEPFPFPLPLCQAETDRDGIVRPQLETPVLLRGIRVPPAPCSGLRLLRIQAPCQDPRLVPPVPALCQDTLCHPSAKHFPSVPDLRPCRAPVERGIPGSTLAVEPGGCSRPWRRCSGWNPNPGTPGPRLPRAWHRQGRTGVPSGTRFRPCCSQGMFLIPLPHPALENPHVYSNPCPWQQLLFQPPPLPEEPWAHPTLLTWEEEDPMDGAAPWDPAGNSCQRPSLPQERASHQLSPSREHIQPWGPSGSLLEECSRLPMPNGESREKGVPRSIQVFPHPSIHGKAQPASGDKWPSPSSGSDPGIPAWDAPGRNEGMKGERYKTRALGAGEGIWPAPLTLPGLNPFVSTARHN